MAKQKTVTFQPEEDVEVWLKAAHKRGRGVRTRIINQALRQCGEAVLANWDNWREPKKPRSFNRPERQSVQEELIAA